MPSSVAPLPRGAYFDKMDEQAWLRRADEHVFAAGVDDVAAHLGRANMAFGIAKIQHAQRSLGLPPDALFIGAPDVTVTRNSRRWAHGFGYGGQVRWSPELVVLDALPNGCGMLVVGLAAPPDERAVRQADREIRRAAPVLDGVPLAYDLGDSNHFVDACALEQVLVEDAPTLPSHLAIIHSSGKEHRRRSPWGPGLYLHESEELQRIAETHHTPWGPLSLLRGEAAAAFYSFCYTVQDFNARRRQLFAEELFGEHRAICNATHQGFRAPGVFHLGAYWFDRAETAAPDPLFPLTLGPDQPVYLVRPRPNYSRAVLEQLGWSERAERTGALAALCTADLLPHGGGYAFAGLGPLLHIDRVGNRRVYILERPDGAPLRLEEIRDPPFAYRDLAVLDRMIALQLAEPVARYRILFVLSGRRSR